MADQLRPDDLAPIYARLAAQEAEITRLKRRRLPRRLLPVLLGAFLVALVPLATLATNPFTDLDPAQAAGHNPNIDAIYNAGITRGCNPPANDHYCPKDFVTREQMATFLARVVGVGGNPAVTNARTAETAQTAQSAISATNAQNAINAQNAGDANTVGGYAPSGLVRVARGSQTGSLSNLTYAGGQAVTLVAPAPGFVLVTATTSAEGYGGTVCGICWAHIRLFHTAGPRSPGIFQRFPASTATESMAITWVFPVSAGAQTFQLEIASTPPDLIVAFANQQLTALYVPFGATGAGTLAVAEPDVPQPAPITVP